MKSVVFFLGICGLLSAQELSRRPLLGIRMSKVNADVVRLMNLPSEKGVLVDNVIPGSTAEKAGIQKGDVLLRMNDTETNSPAQTAALVGGLSPGDKIRCDLIRKGKSITKQTTLVALPVERYEGIEMQYSAVKTVNGLQRLIVSKQPGAQKRPAIVFIGGIGCYSLDFPMEPDRTEVALLNALTREGFVCVRAEKPGVGDNRHCTPCDQVIFMNEVQGYVAAVNAVKMRADVDSGSVFIFGHSMGGVMGPVIAKQTNIKGIVAYGTIGSNFLEYLVKTRRTLAAAYKMSPEETDSYIKTSCECSTWFFADGLTSAEASKKKADCKEYLDILEYRSRAYNNELYALNIPSLWKDFGGRALLLYGEQDFIASEEDHRIVANTVNHYHPGNAKMEIVHGAAHSMGSASSYADALNNDNPFQQEVLRKVLDWLRTIG